LTAFFLGPIIRIVNTCAGARRHGGAVRALLFAGMCALMAGQRGAAAVDDAQGEARPCPADAITVRAARLFDGRGGRLANSTVIVRGGRIASVEACSGAVTYDLGDATLLPGLIDVHVHLDWHFGPDGRFGERPGGRASTDTERRAAILENARLTLDAGFTTVQSLGSPVDLALRAAILNGEGAGPRVITSAGQIVPGSDAPDDLRATVRRLRAAGADVIKIIAAEGLAGAAVRRMEMQLGAICSESRALGLRSVVHAQDPTAIRIAVASGCGQIEHGLLATDDSMRAMADAGVYFDPNIGLNMQHYLEHREAFLGAPGYTDDRFRLMRTLVPTLGPLFARALDARLKMPMGSDAVAGAHGRNAREIVARVREGGQRPSDALAGATSLAAESLGLGSRIGSLQPGYDADIVAVRRDPLRDIRVLEDVRFVMQGGRVHRWLDGPIQVDR
jgi:imidazolonepropionase-like amidohydrolase